MKPLKYEEVTDKFRKLAIKVFEIEKVKRIESIILNLEKERDVRILGEHLMKPN